jgi:hypothetical protein
MDANIAIRVALSVAAVVIFPLLVRHWHSRDGQAKELPAMHARAAVIAGSLLVVAISIYTVISVEELWGRLLFVVIGVSAAATGVSILLQAFRR